MRVRGGGGDLAAREDARSRRELRDSLRWSRREFLRNGSATMALTASLALLAGCNTREAIDDTIGQESLAPVERKSALTKLADVNSSDMYAAVALGCQTMSSIFNSDDNEIPHFQSVVYPNAEFSYNDSHTESHVPGRHLNALLLAETLLGIRVAEDVIDKHADALFYSFSGALPFPLNRTEIGGPLERFLPHNLREGLHGLNALIRYRNSARAREMAERCITKIQELWRPNTWWDERSIREAGVELIEWNYPRQSPFLTGVARAIGPLVKIYEWTKFEPALALAQQIKEVAIKGFFTETGAFSIDLFGGHVHSTTCTLSGLAQLAELTNDTDLIERVWAFYSNGLKEISDPIGWSFESAHLSADPDLGEANNTGDIIETALILGRWGKNAAYEDAERYLRCHLLSSQLRDISFIADSQNPDNEDRKRDVAERHRGAFGFPAPYGHKTVDGKSVSFNMDIVGGAVSSICYACSQSATYDGEGHVVNMLFDLENEAIAVASPYSSNALTVRTKVAAPLTIRLPSWVDRDALRVENAEWEEVDDGGIHIAQPQVDQPTIIHFPLPDREMILKHRTRDIRVRLRGDSVAAMDNFGADFTYFSAVSA